MPAASAPTAAAGRAACATARRRASWTARAAPVARGGLRGGGGRAARGRPGVTAAARGRVGAAPRAAGPSCREGCSGVPPGRMQQHLALPCCNLLGRRPSLAQAARGSRRARWSTQRPSGTAARSAARRRRAERPAGRARSLGDSRKFFIFLHSCGLRTTSAFATKKSARACARTRHGTHVSMPACLNGFTSFSLILTAMGSTMRPRYNQLLHSKIRQNTLIAHNMSVLVLYLCSGARIHVYGNPTKLVESHCCLAVGRLHPGCCREAYSTPLLDETWYCKWLSSLLRHGIGDHAVWSGAALALISSRPAAALATPPASALHCCSLEPDSRADALAPDAQRRREPAAAMQPHY